MSLGIKIVLIVLLFIVLYVALQYFRTKQYIRIGQELAETAVPFEQHPEHATARILNIGDSSVVGTGSDDSKKTVAGRLGSEFPNAEVVNLGVNGTRTPELIERLKSIQNEHFDLIVIHTGGNDIVRFTNLDTFEQSLNNVFELAKNIGEIVVHLHGGNVGTSKLFPAGTRWIFTRRTAQIREISIRIAERHDVHFVDIFRLGKDDPFSTDPDKYYAADYFHPSAIGYGDWYSFISAVIAQTSFTSR